LKKLLEFKNVLNVNNNVKPAFKIIQIVLPVNKAVLETFLLNVYV
jgi:hypothetical protein